MPIPTHNNRKSYEKYSGQLYEKVKCMYSENNVKKSLPGLCEGWWEDKWEINEKVNEGDDEGVVDRIMGVMKSACSGVGKWIYRALIGFWQDDGKWLWQDCGDDVGVVDRNGEVVVQMIWLDKWGWGAMTGYD